MRITEVQIIRAEEGNLLAYADITIDNSFRVRDLKIFRRPRGYFVAMPQIKQTNGRYREIAFAINPKTRKIIDDAVIAEYKKVTASHAPRGRH
jgi:DNA-binding cell septation regulator SpoVG